MRGDEEVGEVQVVRVLIEQLAQLRPFALGQRRLRIAGYRWQVHASSQGQAGGEYAGLLEE